MRNAKRFSASAAETCRTAAFALLFPEVPRIHVIGHPLGVRVSVMANHLTQGFASALETAALHYVRVMDFVRHYLAELAQRYLPLRYEDIVDNQRTTVHGMLDFIGLDYDERCVRCHQNRRYSHTVCYAQVTEGLYDRFRYRNFNQKLRSDGGDRGIVGGERSTANACHCDPGESRGRQSVPGDRTNPGGRLLPSAFAGVAMTGGAVCRALTGVRRSV